MQGIKYSLLQSLHFLKQFNCWLLRADELDISENSRQLQLDGNHLLSDKFSTISLFFIIFSSLIVCLLLIFLNRTFPLILPSFCPWVPPFASFFFFFFYM